ncbi:MAG: hypothetical protein ACREOE_15130, partial [Gemmatimonadales bacterium]
MEHPDIGLPHPMTSAMAVHGIVRTGCRAPTMSCTPGRRTGAHRDAPPAPAPHHRCAHGGDG